MSKLVFKSNATNDADAFVCHSVRLMKFLTGQKGFRYIVVGLNTRTKDKFWAFVKSPELQDALDEWQDMRRGVNN